MKKINITFKLISIFEFLLGIHYKDFSEVVHNNPNLNTILAVSEIEIGFLLFKINIYIHNYDLRKVKGSANIKS
mgnify:FL=1